MTTEVIHELPLDIPVGKTVLFMLAVNREQVGGRPLQRGGGDSDIVDPTPVAAGGAHLSTQNQDIVGLDAELVEEPDQTGAGLIGKHPLHHQTIVSGTHHVGLRTLPTKQFERLHQQ